eukprot:XP_011668278.1 PREDICTED: uncharacterized protein LOC105440154 [Strongylocentrotus purpuratus]
MASAAQSLSGFLRTLSKVSTRCYRITYPLLQSPISRCLGTWNLTRGHGKLTAQSWTKRLSASDSPSGLGSAHITTPVPLLQLVNTMKKKSAIKRRCKDCKVVIKDKRAYVICKTSPRHNQVQG